MSLFERLNNKRYNLQEEKKNPLDKFDAYDNLSKEEQKNLKKTRNIVKNQIKQEGDNISSSKRYPDATSGGKTKTLSNTTTGGKIQKSVSAKVITKKFNQNNPNRPEYVKPDEFKAAETKTKIVNKKQTRPLGQLVKKTKPSKTAISGKLTPGQIDFSKAEELATKRKARIDSKTGKATQAGVFDFAKNRGGFNRMSQGMSKSDFKKMIASDPKKVSQFNKVVSKAKKIASDPTSKAYKDIERKINTSDYAGRIPRKGKTAYMNPSQKAAEIARIKADINAKEALKGRYKKPKTVLKVTQPGSVFRKSKFKGFDVVPTSNPVGKEILKKMDTTGFVPPKPPVKKPSLFKRAIKKVLDPEGWKIPKKDWDLKPMRYDKLTKLPIAQTRLSFKRGPIGTLRKLNAMVPKRYKAIGLALLAAPTIKKTFFTPKAKPKQYAPYVKTIGFDTGKPNKSRELYKKYLKANKPDQYSKEFPKKLPKSMNPFNKPTPKPTQYGSTFTYKDKNTGEMATGSKLTTKKPKNINKNLP
jgi:hypothetical protein